MLCATLSVLSLVALPSSTRGAHKTRVPLFFHIAESAAHRAVPEAFIARQIAQANECFAPVGIRFEDAGNEPLAAEHASLTTRADRDALLPYARKGAVHCMVVAKLMDVDEPGRERRGVHWHPPDTRTPHVVIISTLASDYVLAHELGHFFGNPSHSELPGNLMSYTPGVVPPFLTPNQKRRITSSLKRMQARGELP